MTLKGNILITGGAGFLGRGLIRRAQREQWDVQFIVASRDQQKHEYVKNKYGTKLVKCVVADVLDTARIHMLAQMCNYVLHAAALKHLPECEAQPSQAIRINIDGTMSVMAASAEAHVQRVVCISTDKAAAPLNTYGYTKALVERMVFETVDFPPSETLFNACRYGNVIGSTGSLWPVFKKQAAEKKRLFVTSPDMTRFFVSIEEAVDIVVAAFEAPPGTVIIPQPKALNIGQLAAYLTKEWELEEPAITGLRPGEKNHEAMLAFSERDQLTPYGKYFALHGPTKKPSMTATLPGETSEGADPLTPEDFVLAAIDSEDV